MTERPLGTPAARRTRGGTAPPDKLVTMLLSADAAAGGAFRLVESGRTYTRRQLADAVGRCVAWLREQGVATGDRVLALLDHDARGLVFLAAASALGLRVMMPYNLSAVALPEWRSIVVDARPDVVVQLQAGADGRRLAGVRALAELGPRVVEFAPEIDGGEGGEGAPVGEVRVDHPQPVENFLVLFTSGSTGAPKAVSVSEALVCRRIRSVTRMLRFGPGSRVFMSGLLNNTTGVIFSFGALLHDARLFLPGDRDPARWPAEVAGHRATHIMLRPAAMRRFVESAQAERTDLSCLRVVAYGATALPRPVLAQGRRLMPCDWVQGYGLSETFGPFCWLDEAGHRDPHRMERTYCVGRPDDTLEVRLEPLEGHPPEVGEVLLRGDAVMEGYLDVASGEVARPGAWLRTGDLGSWSPDGDLLLKGRINGTVMSANGHRIYPEEVESVLSTLPGVRDVVLVALPAPDGPAEQPVACISGPLGDRTPSALRAAVTAALTGVLSQEKWPELLYAVTAPFPRSGNDKVLRSEVARQIERDALIEL
ncbi:class I adenylate-forming enzyme family protein [Streptomyces sp. V4I2]|uniref:class I adenylate-forming enzyme family protein n=1 Tax=Streptomyces sp. V4I2 TaxID=3042280 RepID=UPI0027895B33|nr:class I adenylate-forming enzyme family protein [Streptomyces sp. V4I2]MDQ1047526.1 acyl-CoA synthetase (AMP-forming)/AMP-acid ligase II [Streptomyces sp. V4I2]